MSRNEKPLENYSEGELKEMFLDLFFWVAKHRQEWLQEAINRKKRMVGIKT